MCHLISLKISALRLKTYCLSIKYQTTAQALIDRFGHASISTAWAWIRWDELIAIIYNCKNYNLTVCLVHMS